MDKIRVGLFGFGKTGRIIVSEFMKDPQFQVVWIVRKSGTYSHRHASRLLGMETDEGLIFSISELDDDFFSKYPVDVLVDFSDTTAVQYYQTAADQGIRIISAISKYEPSDLELLQSLAKRTAVMYSPNITLGINFLMVASQVLQKIAPHADIEIIEEHFKGKTEVSGTAKKIADGLNLEYDQIHSIRAGGIIGRHEIIFGMPNQTIRLTHDSLSRAAFGQGAIFAAKYLIHQPNGLYTMDNFVTEMFRNNLPIY